LLLYSLYIHIPFCIHRCSYCDFNTYAGLDALIPAYVDALLKEAAYLYRSYGSRLPVHTLYLGGGTPSLLPAMLLQRLVDGIGECFELRSDLEFTLEANPGTINLDYLQSIHTCGVNRLSLGVQSSHPEELHLLERQHNVFDVIEAVKWARQADFQNISLDLIYGLPGQTLEGWEQTLEFILKLSPDHLSLYALTLEAGTPMQSWMRRGLLPVTDEDMTADMYEQASVFVENAGFEQYEISNWALVHPSTRLLSSQHNLQYWRGLPYIGLGAGAHGYVDHTRLANLRHPAAYIRSMGEVKTPPAFPLTPATHESHHNELKEDMGEYMMMALRLVKEGASVKEFKERFGCEMDEVYAEQIRRLIVLGLLKWDNGGEILSLTRRGRLLGNQVFVEFI
jgi:oxygen-independent coproporphyrinogen-3 oxidase